MEGIDELSRTIGEFGARIGGVEKKVNGLCIKVDELRLLLTKHRIKVAGLAGAISLVISAVVTMITFWVIRR